MSKIKKKLLRRVLPSLLFFIAGVFAPATWGYIFLLTAYIIAGYTTLWTALTNIRHGRIFDEHFLMTVATIGALCLGEWKEAVGVMVFYLIGSIFEEGAVDKSRRSISKLMDLRPDTATLEVDGVQSVVDPYDVNVGDVIVVKPGERVPLDGILIEGAGSLDTSALTGESLPVDLSLGQPIASGCININGLLRIEVTQVFEDSTVSRILDLVENSGNKKAKLEKFITKFAKYYTPAVVFAALALAILPPLILSQPFGGWIYRALLFLVISCPCALVISVPLSFFGGIGAASRQGILVKGTNYLESLGRVDTVVFDKTGTLTKGTFHITTLNGPEDLLELAAYGEYYSTHPIGLSIKEEYGHHLDSSLLSEVEELAGKGTKVTYKDKTIYCGNKALMDQLSIDNLPKVPDETVVYVAVDGNLYGHITLADQVKEAINQTTKALTAEGVSTIMMLTGDREEIAAKAAKEAGITNYFSGLMPGDKVDKVSSLIEDENKWVAFVGDGINDAPVLALSHVGIAMGGLGSQAAVEAADIVIMDDDLNKISKARTIAKDTLTIAKQNVIFALGVKGLVLILGAFGLATMWAAVFADVGVSILAILNAMRPLFSKY